MGLQNYNVIDFEHSYRHYFLQTKIQKSEVHINDRSVVSEFNYHQIPIIISEVWIQLQTARTLQSEQYSEQSEQ